MKRRVLLILLFAFMLLAWYGFGQSHSIQKNQGLVFDDKCGAPCWRNISPGKTTVEEAHTLISNFQDINTTYGVKESNLGSPDGYLIFKLPNDIRVEVSFVNDLVVLIAFNSDRGLMTFGKAISEFGPPELAGQSYAMGGFGLPIPVLGDAQHIYFTVIYPRNGISYGFDTYSLIGNNGSLSKNSKATHMEYFAIEYYEALLRQGLLAPSSYDQYEWFEEQSLHNWAGYGNIFDLYPYRH